MIVDDIQSALDVRPIRGPHLIVLALCTMIMTIDGFDIYMVGLIAPAITKGLGERAAGLTQVFLLQQVGLAIGGFLIGPLSDRRGRRPLLIVCAAAFGLLTLAAILAQSLLQLGILRGLAGLFLAGVVPNALALLTETTPTRHRSIFVAIAFTGFVVGSGLASLLVLFLLKDYGWQSCFVVGGLLPLLFVPLAWMFLHESIPFMLSRDATDRRITSALGAFAPELQLTRMSPDLGEPIALPKAPKAGVRELGRIFAPGWLMLTLLLWASYFLSVGSIGMLTSWSSTFFSQLAGVPVQRYAAMNLFNFAGSLLGTLLAGLLLARFRATAVMTLLSLLATISIAALGLVAFGGSASMLVFFCWGFGQIGSQSALNVICAQAYPTAVRSTGVGWAFALGRLGSIAGPLLGGAALALALDLKQIYLAAAGIWLLAMLVMVSLARVVQARAIRAA